MQFTNHEGGVMHPTIAARRVVTTGLVLAAVDGMALKPRHPGQENKLRALDHDEQYIGIQLAQGVALE